MSPYINNHNNNNYQNYNVPCNYNYPYQNPSSAHFNNNILDSSNNWNQQLCGYPNNLSNNVQQYYNYQMNGNYHNYSNRPYNSNFNCQNSYSAFYKSEQNNINT
jgi:hypothetical protein